MNLPDIQEIRHAFSKKKIYLFKTVWCRILFFLQLPLLLPARVWASGDVAPVPLPLLAPREGPLAHDADLGLLHLAPVEDAERLWHIAAHCLKWEEFSSRKDVANFPLLSLFRREENRDGDTCNSDTLHNYWSMLIPCHWESIHKLRIINSRFANLGNQLSSSWFERKLSKMLTNCW